MNNTEADIDTVVDEILKALVVNGIQVYPYAQARIIVKMTLHRYIYDFKGDAS